MQADLKYPFSGNSWFCDQGVQVIGHAFLEDKLLMLSELANLFLKITNENDFEAILQNLNGNFAVVITQPNFQAAAVDPIRSFPILYKINNQQIQFLNAQGLEGPSNNLAIQQFKLAWCVPGNQTLLKDVFQLQAGQFIFNTSKGNSNPKFYFHHFQAVKNLELNAAEAQNNFDNAFQKIEPLLKNKTILVPLSGGYDSRLVLVSLVKAGYTSILAYTYGKRNSHEVEIAEKVCQQLNIKWEFVEYTDSIFDEFFTGNWEAYSRNNHFYTSLPHEQDFFALNELKKRGFLEKPFVAIPGFCGDLLGGSITAYLPNEFSLDGLKELIVKRHFQGYKAELTDLNQIEIMDETTFYDAYQHWFVCNKVSKFIVNSVRVYEHFGGSWVLPLWDNNLIKYWYAIPYQHRKKQKWYNQVLFEFYFKPNGVDFRKPGFDDNYPNKFKESIKKIIPKEWQSSIQQVNAVINKNDSNNLSALNQKIQLKLAIPQNNKEVNNTHALYLLSKMNMDELN
jgi:asparagine synthase (glutamine-hydrolysing)